MEMHQITSGEQTAFNLTGSLGFADHDAFRNVLNAIEHTSSPTITLNVSHLDFIDSAGLGMLLLARDSAHARNVTLVLQGPTGQVKKIFDLSKFDALFTIE